MPLAHRWYRELVEPVQPSVDAALARIVPAGTDLYHAPRAGLGAALALHIARGFGTRRWQEAGRVASIAVEAYNQRVHLGSPTRAARLAWLESDVKRVRRVWSGLMQRDDALVQRVIDRVFGGAHDLGDHTVPEAVLFLRGATAAGVIAGDVPDCVHEALDRYVTALGLTWEAQQGTLAMRDCRGALEAVGLPYATPAAHASLRAWSEVVATRALAALPGGHQVELLGGLIERVATEASGQREPRRWEPVLAPSPTTPPTRVGRGQTLGAFQTDWQPEIEIALANLASSQSQVLARATDFVRGHGGKRVRPILTLAMCQACRGNPRAAVGPAALIEWLHQASLVLDDIVDEAHLRRGAPTLHAATSVPFAVGVAGFILARIHRAVHDVSPQIRDRVVRAASDLVEGQRRELLLTGRADIPLTQYYRIIHAKTAQLFEHAAATGALAAGAASRYVRAAARYGREAGLAFQIVDDLLDYTGDETTFGKRPGTDLRASKATAPVLLLRPRLSKRDRNQLDALLEVREDRTEAEAADGFAWVRTQIERHDIDAACLERAHAHVGRAAAAIGALPDRAGRELLSALISKMVDRNR